MRSDNAFHLPINGSTVHIHHASDGHTVSAVSVTTPSGVHYALRVRNWGDVFHCLRMGREIPEDWKAHCDSTRPPTPISDLCAV